MKRVWLPFLCLVSMPAIAGNVMEMVTRDTSGAELDRMIFYTEADRSRMDQEGADGSYSVIFLDDQFFVLDHAEKSYIVMDEAMLDGIASQINDAMKEMEAQLASLPPEQRAMVEQMMGEQMAGMGMGADLPVLEMRRVGPGSWQDYDCNMSEMLEDGVKIQEICAVDFDDVDGSGAVRDSYVRMGNLLSEFFDAIPFAGQGVRNPMEMLGEMEGFPVRAVEFENSKPVRETILESSVEKAIDAAMFTLPQGYTRIDPLAE